MNCQEARRWLSPYLDSELGATKTFEVSEHLRVCDGCRDRFESERRVDELTVGTLLRSGSSAAFRMPGECRDAIERAIRGATGRGRVWRLWPMAALAASIVFVVALSTVLVGLPSGALNGAYAGQWAVRQLAAIAGDNAPFLPERGKSNDLAAVSRSVLATALSFDETAGGRHKMEVVNVEQRSDEDGNAWLEVRMNCCGQPVLLSVAREDRPGRLADVARRVGKRSNYTHTDGEVNVAGRRIGDLVILAVSRHPVKQVVDGLTVTAT